MWHTGHLSQKRVSGREGGNRALECLYGYSVARKLASSAGMSMPGECLAAIFRGEVLDAAHWVGAITRSAEGSFMQLQVQLCGWIKAAM